jgi:hypothetical protein
MKKGTQIIYVPAHAEGDLTHPDIEEGFVMSVHKAGAFCRYWNTLNRLELRTKSTSELTPFLYLREQTPPFTHTQKHVNKTILAIELESLQ